MTFWLSVIFAHLGNGDFSSIVDLDPVLATPSQAVEVYAAQPVEPLTSHGKAVCQSFVSLIGQKACKWLSTSGSGWPDRDVVIARRPGHVENLKAGWTRAEELQ